MPPVQTALKEHPVARVGDVITILRKSRGITQAGLADQVGVSQVAVARWEANERQPDDERLAQVAAILGVTERLLRHGDQFSGALAMEAHMRRQKSTKASVWRRLEAQLNERRLHASLLFEEVSINADRTIPTVDPDETSPESAARLVRAQWGLPLGPVVNLTAWLESAGCLIFLEDFDTHRVSGLSQWVGDHPVILANAKAPTDRHRMTLAHELGHLVLHSRYATDQMEKEADRFAAEFLMPETTIKPELRALDIGKLTDLKREWGVSMQALFERAYSFKFVSPDARTRFYKQMNARGWKTSEPGSATLPTERPQLPTRVGVVLRERGMTPAEIAEMSGHVDPTHDPFQADHGDNRLRLVADRT